MSDSTMSLKNIGATIPQKEIKAPQKFDSKEKLEKAAHEFEGVFMDLVLKQMRNTVPDSEFGDSEKTKFFQTMLDTEYSNISAKKNKLGLADAIIRQMTPRLEAEEKENMLKAIKAGGGL